MSRKIKLENVSVELTNFCNLSCWFCPHSEMTRSIGYMNVDLAEKIAIDLGKLDVKTIQLHGIGESLAHSEFRKIAENFRIYNPNTILRLSTNSTFLSLKNFEKTLGIINNLVISIDGTDFNSYARNRIGGNYNDVVDNVKTVLKKRHERRWTVPSLEIRMIDFNLTSKEKQKFISQWKENLFHTDMVYITPSVSFGGQIPEINKRIKRCSALYRHIAILWDGRLTTCCWDSDGKNVIGDLNLTTVKDLFWGDYYDSLREKHENKTLQKEINLLCHTCLEEST